VPIIRLDKASVVSLLCLYCLYLSRWVHCRLRDTLSTDIFLPPSLLLTLQPQAEQFLKRHAFKGVVVDGEGTTRDAHQLFPVTGPHGWVAQVIDQRQARLIFRGKQT